MNTPANLFADALPPAIGERFDTLLQHGKVVIERIVSSSQPDQTEYQQSQDEWVVLLQGEAELIVDGQPVPLRAGQHLFIAAGTPHTVKRTSPGAMWLAVHIHPDTAPA
ncbi:MAG: cupin domain-containing protein [Aquabacterium sp.]